VSGKRSERERERERERELVEERYGRMSFQVLIPTVTKGFESATRKEYAVRDSFLLLLLRCLFTSPFALISFTDEYTLFVSSVLLLLLLLLPASPFADSFQIFHIEIRHAGGIAKSEFRYR